MDAPQHVVFFKHVSNHELFVSINHQNHAIGLRSIGEDEGNVGWRWRPKHDGVHAFTFGATNLEIRTVADFFLVKDVVGRHFFTRGTVRGIVEDFVFLPHLVIVHGTPSLVALNPLGLNPPTRLVCKP